MNIFHEIEGLHGENLVSAVFRFLLLESLDIRKLFFRLISTKTRIAFPDIESQFECLPQQHTRPDSDGRIGYLDLLIETPSAVIGIENKLHAGFTGGQPHKYLQSVSDLANTKAASEGNRTVDHCVVVIGPESRSKEIEEHIDGTPHLFFLSWRGVLEAIESSRTHFDATILVLANAFKGYVDDHIAFMPHFETLLPRLKGEFSVNGSDPQRVLVEQVSDLLTSRSRLRGSSSWYGCYFDVDIAGTYAWMGYMKTAVLIDSPRVHPSEFVIVTSCKLSLQDEEFRPIQLRGSNFLYNRNMKLYAWAVNYDRNWNVPERWRAAFEDIRTQLEGSRPAA